MGTLAGRVALVTGASQGIGRACALALAEAGATVALCARNVEKLEEVAAEINGKPTHDRETVMNGAPGVVAEAEGEMEDAAAVEGGAASAGAGLTEAEAAVADSRWSEYPNLQKALTIQPELRRVLEDRSQEDAASFARDLETILADRARTFGDGPSPGGKQAHVFALDLSSEESVKECVKAVIARLGKVDILVNNGGIARDILTLRMKKKDWDDVLATNLTGAFLMTQAVMSSMLKGRWGRVVNIASVVGETGQAGQANYAASKAGLIGLTKSLARELASRTITVNAVAPGYIETAMTAVLTDDQRKAMTSQIPLGRAGTDRDIAAAVAFLASEEAGYITGHTLDVNGGMYMG